MKVGFLDWLSNPAHDVLLIACTFGGFDLQETVKRVAFHNPKSKAEKTNITTVLNVLQDLYDEDHAWDNVT